MKMDLEFSSPGSVLVTRSIRGKRSIYIYTPPILSKDIECL